MRTNSPKHLLALFAFVLASAALAETPTEDQFTAQERFDYDVGRVHAYGLMAAATATKCAELFPGSARAIEAAQAQWQARNSKALQEAADQWMAHVERDSLKSHLPISSYSQQLGQLIASEQARLFLSLGGSSSSRAQAFCASYPQKLMMMSIESRYPQELGQMYHCHESGMCPNLKTR